MRRLTATLLIALAPLAAAQNEAAEPAYRWAEPVKEDANLYRIDDKLYRSEQLTRADAPHIKALCIKSVVNLRYFDRNDNHTALAHIRSSKSPKPGTKLIFEGDICAVMVERGDELFCLRFEGEQTVYELLEQNGHLPLPPYIERAAGADDDTRYQTVYAKHQGAVAAPTAGLHFTDELLGRLKAKQ